MNTNVIEIALDKRDDSMCLELNTSCLSDINFRNNSFYSCNDNVGNEMRHSSDVAKSKLDKKSEVMSYKMLPYYIEKVSKNIQYLDDLMKKQHINAESQNVLNTSTPIPVIENLNTLIKKSVDTVNEVLASNKIVLEKLDKKKLIHTRKSANFSLDAKSLQKLAKTGKNFDVIDEKDEDIMTKKELTNRQDQEVGLKSARNVKKSILTLPLSPLKKSGGTSAKIVGIKSYNTNNFGSNNSILAKYKTANTSINNYASANKPSSIPQPAKTGLYVNRNGRNSAKDIKSNYKTFMTTNTLPNKDPSQLKKSLNTSKLSAQIKAAAIVKKPTLADQRQNSMSNIRKSFASTNVNEKPDLRRVLSPTPYRTEPNKILTASANPKGITKPNLEVSIKTSLNQSHNSNNHSINSGVKQQANKCNCLCTCNHGIKNTSQTNINTNKLGDIQSSLFNNNTTAATEVNSRILTTINPHFNIIDNGTELKGQIKKLCGMYLINSEYNAYKYNKVQKDAKLLSFIKSTLKSIDEDSETSTKHHFYNLSTSNNYNSNNSNSGNVMNCDRRKELNKRRDEIKVWRIVQIQRKWREFLMKKLLGLTNFSLKTQIKSETIKLCKEKIFSMFKDTMQEKLIEMIQNMNKANELWNEINENSSINSIIDHLANDFGYDFISQNTGSLNNFYFNCLSKILTDIIKLSKS